MCTFCAVGMWVCSAVSDMLADADAQLTLQPGQRTVWDINV